MVIFQFAMLVYQIIWHIFHTWSGYHRYPPVSTHGITVHHRSLISWEVRARVVTSWDLLGVANGEALLWTVSCNFQAPQMPWFIDICITYLYQIYIKSIYIYIWLCLKAQDTLSSPRNAAGCILLRMFFPQVILLQGWFHGLSGAQILGPCHGRSWGWIYGIKVSYILLPVYEYIISYQIISNYIISYYIILYHNLSYYIILYHIISY